MIKYPNVSTIPWYKAVVNQGDCLYLPYHWIHHVRERGREREGREGGEGGREGRIENKRGCRNKGKERGEKRERWMR